MASQKHKPRNTEMDLALGQQIRALRRKQGDTQEGLGAKVGLTFQQIQKYENGSNRISALMLVKLAEALSTTPTAILHSVREPDAQPAVQTEEERLLDAFRRIPSAEARASALKMILALAQE